MFRYIPFEEALYSDDLGPYKSFGIRIIDFGGKTVASISDVSADYKFIADLCELLAALHKAGICHGDTNLRNIYRTNSGSWGVIDLDGCVLSDRPVGRRAGIHELSRLASSFLKLIPVQGIDSDLDGDIPGIFAQEYKKHTSFDADCPYYRRRVEYLSLRKRK